MSMPSDPDLSQPPPRRDPSADALAELVASVRHWLAQPGDEDVAVFDVTEAVQRALQRAWLKTTGTPAQRFAMAVQSAGDLLDALGLALAERPAEAEG